MKAKLLQEDGERSFALIYDKGDEFMQVMLRFAREHGLAGSHFTAIGAFSDATLGFFDRAKKEYLKSL